MLLEVQRILQEPSIVYDFKLIMRGIQSLGAKRVVCGSVGARLADSCVLLKFAKLRSFPPSPMHACPCHGPWATSLDG